MFNPSPRLRACALPLLCLLLAGCQEQAPPPPAEVSRPAEILEIVPAGLGSGLRFPGRVRAVQRAELAFNLPGRIVEFPVAEGEAVAPDDLIARLDPESFETRLAAAQAELDKATADYERVGELWERSKAVPRAEVDQKRTAMEVTRSAFAAARKDLDDTRLTAPFGGVIARRLVEPFQNVQAKEPVVSLQNVDELEVVIHVPERVVRSEPKRVAAFAQFADMPERRFPVRLKSYATEADPQTQTYEVVLALTRPAGVSLLPGMALEVFPAETPPGEEAAGVLIPLRAVLAGTDGAPSVWVVDPASSRVSRRPIEVGAIQGEDIVVLAGLSPGERIVTAGVNHLRDGMLVHPL
ncbi:MAG: efflux RND transporter periplasmic adaptor subunit [Chromatiaceae bacterium]|jgi:RND family efflux transporter MFP subunit|nr:efflux RND transporter periplasmic adaptor subunit [Chromatiaceae bacterium]